MSEYVCHVHRRVKLTDVRDIRADVARPEGIKVVGSCRECQKPDKRTHGKRRHVLSYGVPAEAK